mmetsp:Transcript_7357/g.30457  ORF Transcript_7357/g.30457 Transcript_7357/m.30457 type:complete len:286 (+) Transcript_7357:3035-3892(+)
MVPQGDPQGYRDIRRVAASAKACDCLDAPHLSRTLLGASSPNGESDSAGHSPCSESSLQSQDYSKDAHVMQSCEEDENVSPAAHSDVLAPDTLHKNTPSTPISRAKCLKNTSSVKASRKQTSDTRSPTSNKLDAKPSWFTRKFTAMLFPNAKHVDLDAASSEMEAYYDTKLGRWIFPNSATGDGEPPNAEVPAPPLVAATEVKSGSSLRTAPQSPPCIKSDSIIRNSMDDDPISKLTAPPPARVPRRHKASRSKSASAALVGEEVSPKYAIFTPLPAAPVSTLRP